MITDQSLEISLISLSHSNIASGNSINESMSNKSLGNNNFVKDHQQEIKKKIEEGKKAPSLNDLELVIEPKFENTTKLSKDGLTKVLVESHNLSE